MRTDSVAFGRHMKAALVLANFTLAELAAEVAAELEIGRGTLERVMQGKRAAKPYEVREIARALGVPEEFLLHGPGQSDRPTEMMKASQALEALVALDQRLEALAARVEQTRTLVAEGFGLQERLRELEAEQPPPRADRAPQRGQP